jgi:FkbM family methyltransferase
MRPRDIADYFALRRIARNPWQLVRYRWSGRADHDLNVELRDAGPLYLRAGLMDHHIFHRIFLMDEYRLGRPTPGKWDCVVDLGANVGFFSARVAPFARRVIAYEPMRAHCEQFQKNLAGCNNVTLVRAAVSGRAGSMRIYAPAVAALSGKLSEHVSQGRDTAPEDYEEIETVTLDAVFEKHDIAHCDLLKMDVEGDEYETLHVADRETLRRIERIHGEFHDVRPEDPRTRIGNFCDFLECHGFTTCVAPHRKKSNHGMFFAHRKG